MSVLYYNAYGRDAPKPMRRDRIIIWTALIAACIAAPSTLLIPVTPRWPNPVIEFYLPPICTTIMACLCIGAAVLFTSNLQSYKVALRRAYTWIAIGIVMTAVGTVETSILAALNLLHSLFVQSGLGVLPIVISGPILYFAIRYLARLIGVKHTLMRAWLVLGVIFVISIIMTLLPHVPVTLPPPVYALSIMIDCWTAGLLLVAGSLVLIIRRRIGVHYANAMAWMACSLLIMSLLSLVYMVYSITSNALYDPLIALMNTIAVASGFMWLRASYAFAATKNYEHDNVPFLYFIFGRSQSEDPNHPKTVIAMITYAAGLVSNARDIDPMLDDMRAITSTLQPGELPSDKHTNTLLSTYLNIENYLETRETIRTFAKEDLRAQFDPSLRTLITRYEMAKSKVSAHTVLHTK